MGRQRAALLISALCGLRPVPVTAQDTRPDALCIAVFSADITVPLGHRLMGILPVKATSVADPLEARGLVLLGPEAPIVLVALDWCEVRNDAYDRWREALAEAAGTTRERVLLSSVHQHDAPVADLGAERLLAARGLGGELCDTDFHERCVQRVAEALRASLATASAVTHIGAGEALALRIASNRRVLGEDGVARFDRGSSSGGQDRFRDAPEGLIDPWLKLVSFWSGETPIAAFSTYATHPMSHYGKGEVSADFIGLARRARSAELPGVFLVHASGASGDVTAGKHNDGSRESRPALTARLQDAMKRAWEATRRAPAQGVRLATTPLELPFHDRAAFTREALRRTLEDPAAPVRERILAAMGLSSLERLAAGRPIDLACLDLGPALIVLLPGEAFVGYQLLAERLRPDVLVACVGYGECWPGYIPTRAAFDEAFPSDWRWVSSGAPSRLEEGLARLLCVGPPVGGLARARTDAPGEVASIESLALDVFPPTAAHPRYSEGSILPLRDGALLFAITEFLGGESDFDRARIVARRSLDGGATWGEPRVLQENVGERNVMSASLLRIQPPDAPPAIALFYLVKNGFDDLDVHVRLSTDEAETFATATQVTRDPGYHVLNNDRVIQLRGGRILCPTSSSMDVRAENHFVARCQISDDGARTWRPGVGSVDLPRRGAMEPGLLELQDGTILMILRTQLGEIHAARSPDQGDTWSEPAPWGVRSPEAPATLGRIPSTGDLLLVWNPDVVPGAGHGGPRTPLRLALSADEGRTWSPGLDLEARRDQTFAYTSLAFWRGRALLSYYVRDEATGRIGTRFRSLSIEELYRSR